MLRDLPGNMKKFGSLLAFLSKYLMQCSLKATSMKVDLDSQSALQELCLGSSLVTLKKIILNIMQINIAVLQSEADTLVMNLVSVHLKASFTERRTQSHENNAYMPARTHTRKHMRVHTHTHTKSDSPSLQVLSWAHSSASHLSSQLASPSFVPRLHTVMSRSCLWGVQPGRRLVFRALLFFFLLLSFLLLGFFVCTGAG